MLRLDETLKDGDIQFIDGKLYQAISTERNEDDEISCKGCAFDDEADCRFVCWNSVKDEDFIWVVFPIGL